MAESDLEPKPKLSAGERLAQACDGAPALMARLSGAPMPVAPEAALAQVVFPWSRKPVPAQLSPQQLGWIARRDRATYLKERFDEPAPDGFPKELW